MEKANEELRVMQAEVNKERLEVHNAKSDSVQIKVFFAFFIISETKSFKKRNCAGVAFKIRLQRGAAVRGFYGVYLLHVVSLKSRLSKLAGVCNCVEYFVLDNYPVCIG